MYILRALQFVQRKHTVHRIHRFDVAILVVLLIFSSGEMEMLKQEDKLEERQTNTDPSKQ